MAATTRQGRADQPPYPGQSAFACISRRLRHGVFPLWLWLQAVAVAGWHAPA
jgi:hypothetical protein